jgi:hypothetical protein
VRIGFSATGKWKRFPSCRQIRLLGKRAAGNE